MIRVGILGYGNLGKGVELAVRQNDDMELAAVYTRRNPETVTIATPDVPVRSVSDLETGNEDIDVLILCGGSATDLPEQTPKYAALYNVVDSFDTHAKIPTHFANVDEAAKGAGKTALISCGKVPTTPSGVVAFPRGIPMRSVVFLALLTLVNTPFPFLRHWKRFVRALTLSSPRAKSIRVSAGLFWKRALTLLR